MSLFQPRPSIPRQPSLPAIRTSVPLSLPSRHTLDSGLLPRVRSQSIVSPLRPTFALASQPAVKSPLSSNFDQPTPIPAAPAPVGNANSDLERQKLNALVIASGLADETEMRASEPASGSSPPRLCPEEPDRVVPVEVESPRDEDTENYTSAVAPQAQVTTDPYSSRTSISRDDIDEFDEDASYYGKEIDPLFSPYSYPPSTSKDVSPASKWSLSSSVEMDLGNKRSSSSKSLKSKGEKLKSLLSRFSSNSQSSSSDKHVLSFAVDGQEKSIGRQRSHSDVLESIAGRSSESSQAPAITCGSWESVPPTPSALSTTSISISTSYSLATPSDNEDDSNDHGIPTCRYSDEKFPAGKYVSPSESPVALTRDTSSSLTCPGMTTSIAHSVVDTAGRSLKHSISTASLKTHGLKGLVSKIGLSPAESSHEESSGGGKGAPKEADKRSTSVPRTFRERMMLRNNGSALSLILGKGGNKAAKAAKPKRKLLISGVERGNYRKYEAISSWCEVSSCCIWYLFPNISPRASAR